MNNQPTGPGRKSVFTHILKNKFSKMALLAGTALGSVLMVSPAAATVVANEAELIAAINDANGGTLGDNNITLTANITLTGALPMLSPTNPLTMDFDGFSLTDGGFEPVMDISSGNVTFDDTAGTGDVTGSGQTLLISDDNVSLVNNGNIVSNGTIPSSFTGGAAVKIGSVGPGVSIGTVITNTGLIQADQFGVLGSLGLDGGGFLIDTALDTTVINSGDIIGINNDGIRLIGGGTIINTGNIEGQNDNGSSGTDGVSAFFAAANDLTFFDPNVGAGLLDNQIGGTISGNRFGVIFSDGGTVINAGVLTGGGGGILIQNAGPAGAGTVALVDNSGTINQTSVDGSGISGFPGPDIMAGVVIFEAPGVPYTLAQIDNSGDIVGARKGIMVHASGVVINNSGNITGNGTNVSSGLFGDAGIRIGSDGSDVFHGTIINNSGVIIGTGGGILGTIGVDGGGNALPTSLNTTVINTGDIIGVNNDGIRLIGGGTIVNAGNIEGQNNTGSGTDGVSAFFGAFPAPPDLTFFDPGVGVALLDNQIGGTISGLRFGAYFSDGGTIGNAGDITGGAGGVILHNGTQSLSTVALLDNSGTINQTSLDGSGITNIFSPEQMAAVGIFQADGVAYTLAQIDNSGDIIGARKGILVQANGVIINNSGNITGNGTNTSSSIAGDAGIKIGGAGPAVYSGTIINNSGVITGTGGGIIGTIGFDGGVNLIDTSLNTTVINTGDIIGVNNDGIRLIGGGTIVNAGNIEGQNNTGTGTDGVSAFFGAFPGPPDLTFFDPGVGVALLDNQIGGTISGLRFGAYFSDGGTIGNAGDITGGAGGVILHNGTQSLSTVALLDNSGTINQTSLDGSGITNIFSPEQMAAVGIFEALGVPYLQAQIDNSGDIIGARKGVLVQANGVVINNSGNITGNGTTISSLLSGDAGIRIGSDGSAVYQGTIINNSGVITGTSGGILGTIGIDVGLVDTSLNTTVINTGDIIGVNNDGIRLVGGGTIINAGNIEGQNDNGSTGTDGVSAFFAAGNDLTFFDPNVGVGLLDNQLGGTIAGHRFGVTFSDGGTIGNAGDITGGAGGVILHNGALGLSTVALLDNSGTINQTSLDGSGISNIFSPEQMAAVGIFQADGVPYTLAQIDNSGDIIGARKGVLVQADGVIINNSGNIYGNGTNAGSSIAGDGAIKIGSAGPAVYAGTVINNSGLIQGQEFGVHGTIGLDGGGLLIDTSLNTTVINTGDIIGIDNDGVRLLGGGTIINSGNIEGQNDNGSSGTDGVAAFFVSGYTAGLGLPDLSFFDPAVGAGYLDNQASGTVTGDRAGVIFSNGGTVDNAGVIIGGTWGIFVQDGWAGASPSGGLTGTVNNSGQIFGLNEVTPYGDLAGSGIVFTGFLDEGVVVNSGLIQGVRHGVFSIPGLDLLNEATGVITGDSDGNGTGDAIRTAVTLAEAAGGGPSMDFDDNITNLGAINGNVILGLGSDTLINMGTIGSVVDLGDGDDVMFNSGVITGNVLMGEGADTLTFVSTSSITGGADGGNGVDSLILEDDAADPDAEVDGSLFTNFENVSVNAGDTVNLGFSSGASYTLVDVTGAQLNLADGSAFASNMNIGAGGVLTINQPSSQAPLNFNAGSASITGDVTFGAGSTYEVDISAQGSGTVLDVTGGITIDPTAGVVVNPLQVAQFTKTQDYTILTATSGVTGAFGSVSAPSNVLFPVLLHNANDVILRVGRQGMIFTPGPPDNPGPPGGVPPGGGNPNPFAIGTLLDQIDPADGFNVVPLIEAFLLLGSDFERQAFLDQFSGAVLSNIGRNSLSNASMTTYSVIGHLDEIRQAGSPEDTNACYKTCLTRNYLGGPGSEITSGTLSHGANSVWMKTSSSLGLYSEGVNLTPVGESHGVSSAVTGGMDRWISSNVVMGFTFGFSGSGNAGLSDSIRGKTRYTHVGAYMAANLPNNLYVANILAVNFGDLDVNRQITAGSLNLSPRSEFDTRTISLYTEVGKDMNILGARFQPFVSLHYVDIDSDPITERGLLDMVYSLNGMTSMNAALGFRANKTFETGNGLTIRPTVSFRVMREFGSARFGNQITASVLGLQGQSANILGLGGFENSALVSAGVELSKGKHFRFVIDYDGFYASDYVSHTGSGRLIWSF